MPSALNTSLTTSLILVTTLLSPGCRQLSLGHSDTDTELITDDLPDSSDPNTPSAIVGYNIEGEWAFGPIKDASGQTVGTLYNNQTRWEWSQCLKWSNEVLANNRLPKKISHMTTELGGMPILQLDTESRASLFTGSAQKFALTLGATWSPLECSSNDPLSCASSGEIRQAAGTTTILDRSNLFCLDVEPADPNCESINQPIVQWWGRKTPVPSNPWPSPFKVDVKPFHDIVINSYESTRAYSDFRIWLDIFTWEVSGDSKEPAKKRENASCVLRLFDLPGDGEIVPFMPRKPLASEVVFPSMIDECIYEQPFNPFFNRDLATQTEFAYKSHTEHGIPNTFDDAQSGGNFECEMGGCDSLLCSPNQTENNDLLPRLQLVGSNDHSRHQPLEAYCNNHVKVCQNLNLPTFAKEFNKHFGLLKESSLGKDLIRARYQHSDTSTGIHWGGTDGSDDRGMWRKPTLKAGYDGPITIIIRNEGVHSYRSESGSIYDTVICDPDTTEASGHYVYFDAQGTEHSSKSFPLNCLPCNHHSDDEDLAIPYRDVHEEYCPSHYGIEADQGIRLRSEGSTQIPAAARGGGFLEIGTSLKALSRTAESKHFVSIRRFPVYFDGINRDFANADLSSSVSSKEACWIGATNWTRSADTNEMVETTVIPSALGNYLEHHLSEDLQARNLEASTLELKIHQYHRVDSWLMGGDVNRWFKKKKDGIAQLFTLAGDVRTRPGKLDWFKYRGSTVHFEHYIDTKGKPAWTEEQDGIARGTKCPSLKPVLLDDGTPWEMVRSTGQNRENGLSHQVFRDGKSRIVIDRCQETGKETTAPVSGFQFQDQEQSGDSYVWFYVGKNWGWVSPFAQANQGDEIKKRYDLMTKKTLGTGRYEYDRQLEPWGSFIAHWDPETGIDDMARSVSWDCLEDTNDNGKCDNGDRGTTFMNTANIVVNNLATAIDVRRSTFNGPPDSFDLIANFEGEGLIVWHSGCYRCSDLYLSFVTKKEALDPSKYWHFAGYGPPDETGEPTPIWSRSESAAVPVIWDVFGEFTVVDLRERNASTDCSRKTVFDDFAVIYPIVGQKGIVVREGHKPWGPFSDFIPVYGSSGENTEFDTKLANETGKKPISAYSGYTHVDLWGDTVCNEQNLPQMTTIRFNVSVWTPYKTLLVEAKVTRNKPLSPLSSQAHN